jgi:hypothetical protein
MRKDVQEALENAIAEFETRQQAEQERLRERERFETVFGTHDPPFAIHYSLILGLVDETNAI